MSLVRTLALVAGLSLCGTVAAQQKPAPVGFPDAPGKDVLVSKCFQCHAPTMWMDQRQDRRAWEATLYRMLRRGALWTPDEISQTAESLGGAYGKSKGKASSPAFFPSRSPAAVSSRALSPP